jgi:hypothetical protein
MPSTTFLIMLPIAQFFTYVVSTEASRYNLVNKGANIVKKGKGFFAVRFCSRVFLASELDK